MLNQTAIEHEVCLEEERNILTVIISSSFGFLLTLTATIGNIAVLIICFTNEPIQSQVGSLLIANLAIGDLTTILFATFPSSLSIVTGGWPFGEIFCHIQSLLYYICFFEIVITLAIISVDRTIAIFKPLHYHQIVSRRRLLVIIISSWIEPIGIVILFWFEYGISYIKCEVTCGFSTSEFLEKPLVVLPPFVFNDVILPLVIITLNGLIVWSAVKGSKSNSIKSNKVHPNKNGDSKLKTDNQEAENNLKVVISICLLVIVFIVCIFPFLMLKVIPVFWPDVQFPYGFTLFAILFQYMSSAVNPFIYGILRKDFRAAFKKLALNIKRFLFNQ